MKKSIQTVYTASEARDNLYTLVKHASVIPITIHLQGESPTDVVVMGKDEYDSWLETIEILSDSEAMQGIRESMKDTKFFTLDEVKKELGIE